MKWPGQRELEAKIENLEREHRNFTDAVLLAALDTATTSAAETVATAAVETAAGFIARAFASAEVDAPAPVQEVLTPACLALIGRALTRSGEAVFEIAVRDGMIRLYPASGVTMEGNEDPASWVYTINVGGPTTTAIRKKVSADRILHLRHSQDPENHWRGIGPVQSAVLSGHLSANTVKALRNEQTMPIGGFLPTPLDGEDDTIGALKADIRKAKGDLLLVEGGDWDAAGSATAAWDVKRFGPDIPAGNVDLLKTVSAEILAACGLPPVLFSPDAAGPAQREAYRQALFSVVSPLGRIIAGEIEAKLSGPVTFDWSELRAADIVSRARGFQSMVGAGMDIAKAASLAGLMAED